MLEPQPRREPNGPAVRPCERRTLVTAGRRPRPHRAEPALPGGILRIGTDRLHVVTAGDGSPPVVLSSGLGGAWFDWLGVAELLADRHRLVIFDRPGLGGSPPLSGVATLRAEADRLAALSDWAGSPVIAVGHSYAAFHVEALARLYPDLVAGLVLVDPSYEQQPPAHGRLLLKLGPAARFAGALLERTGAARRVGPRLHTRTMDLLSHRGVVAPAHQVMAVYGRGHVLGTTLKEDSEYRQMAVDLVTLRRHRPFPPGVSVRVITALGGLKGEAERREQTEAQAVLAAMGRAGRQIVLPNARHMVQVDTPEVVARAVAELCADR
jgi:pimeloyl-ACP methyl ester carboxylesterase